MLVYQGVSLQPCIMRNHRSLFPTSSSSRFNLKPPRAFPPLKSPQVEGTEGMSLATWMYLLTIYLSKSLVRFLTY